MTFISVKEVPTVRCADFKEGHFYKFRSFFHQSLGLGRVWVKIEGGKRKYFYQDWMGRVTVWKHWDLTRFVEVRK